MESRDKEKKMKYLIVATAALVALLAAVTVAGGTGAAAGLVAPSPLTYTDPTGDSGAAPDIINVVVSSDASGTLNFQLNFASPLTTGNHAEVLIDSDQNTATGDPKSTGANYGLWASESTGRVG